MSTPTDTQLLDWLEKSIKNDECDPTCQFISLDEGPLHNVCQVRIYDGLTTHGFTNPSLRVAMGDAMTFASRGTTPEKGPAADPAQMTGTTAKHEPEETKAQPGARPGADL